MRFEVELTEEQVRAFMRGWDPNPYPDQDSPYIQACLAIVEAIRLNVPEPTSSTAAATSTGTRRDRVSG